MEIQVQSRRRSLQGILDEYPGSIVVDVTSKGPEPWVKFSPFFPHGGIPVPFSPGATSESVEGIWQGLKVFQNHGVDEARLAITAMKGIKRTERKFGTVLGHQKGLKSVELLDYLTARKLIYLPSYRWVLEHRLSEELDTLRDLAARHHVILLDYETNCDLSRLTRPLSHAWLVKCFLSNTWPD